MRCRLRLSRRRVQHILLGCPGRLGLRLRRRLRLSRCWSRSLGRDSCWMCPKRRRRRGNRPVWRSVFCVCCGGAVGLFTSWLSSSPRLRPTLILSAAPSGGVSVGRLLWMKPMVVRRVPPMPMASMSPANAIVVILNVLGIVVQIALHCFDV